MYVVPRPRGRGTVLFSGQLQIRPHSPEAVPGTMLEVRLPYQAVEPGVRPDVPAQYITYSNSRSSARISVPAAAAS